MVEIYKACKQDGLKSMRQHDRIPPNYGEAEKEPKHVTISPGGKLEGEWRAGTLEVKVGSGCSNRGETKYSCIFRCQVCWL